IFEIHRPTELFVFADAMLAPSSSTGQVMNSALLDPPRLWDGGGWVTNDFPTTSFRHDHKARAIAAHADGSAGSHTPDPAALTNRAPAIGSLSLENAPAYTPDWRGWSR